MMKKAKQDKRSTNATQSTKNSSSSSPAMSSTKSQEKSLLYKIKSGVEWNSAHTDIVIIFYNIKKQIL